MSFSLPLSSQEIQLKRAHNALSGSSAASSVSLSLQLNPLVGRTTPQTTRFSQIFGGRPTPNNY